MMEPGDTGEVKLALMWFPDEPYAQVRPGSDIHDPRGTLGRWLRGHFESEAGILPDTAPPSSRQPHPEQCCPADTDRVVNKKAELEVSSARRTHLITVARS